MASNGSECKCIASTEDTFIRFVEKTILGDHSKAVCHYYLLLQVEVDWDKVNAKINMELQKGAFRPGAKPYSG